MRAPWLALGLVLASCLDAREPAEELGGETHFMSECDEQCDGGLECVCGVCTRACEDDAECTELAEGASCMVVDEGARACVEAEGTSVPAQACAPAIAADPARPVFVADGEEDEPCTGACPVAQPLVLLLVDTSGSMEREADCPCTTPACNECLPDCSLGERNRWVGTIEALAGTLDGYSCERLERTEANGATFDIDYFVPHHAPSGVPQDDGVLDLYRDRLRFGLATFDGRDTYVGEDSLVAISNFDFDESAGVAGMWSYNPLFELGHWVQTPQGGLPGEFNYPGDNVSNYMDTGVRGPDAAQGALVMAS